MQKALAAKRVSATAHRSSKSTALKRAKNRQESAEAQNLMRAYAQFFTPPATPVTDFKILTLFDYSIPILTSNHS